MERIFFYSGLDFEGKFPNGKRKLDVLFKDRHGNILGRWTPRWDEVQLICAVLSVVEKQNNPDTQYIKQLIEGVSSAVSGVE